MLVFILGVSGCISDYGFSLGDYIVHYRDISTVTLIV